MADMEAALGAEEMVQVAERVERLRLGQQIPTTLHILHKLLKAVDRLLVVLSHLRWLGVSWYVMKPLPVN